VWIGSRCQAVPCHVICDLNVLAKDQDMSRENTVEVGIKGTLSQRSIDTGQLVIQPRD